MTWCEFLADLEQVLVLSIMFAFVLGAALNEACRMIESLAKRGFVAGFIAGKQHRPRSRRKR